MKGPGMTNKITMLNLPVSSNLSQIGHDGKDMYVKFCGGATYCYSSVPKEVYEQAFKHPSPGKWLHNVVKGKYPHRKLEPET